MRLNLAKVINKSNISSLSGLVSFYLRRLKLKIRGIYPLNRNRGVCLPCFEVMGDWSLSLLLWISVQIFSWTRLAFFIRSKGFSQLFYFFSGGLSKSWCFSLCNRLMLFNFIRSLRFLLRELLWHLHLIGIIISIVLNLNVCLLLSRFKERISYKALRVLLISILFQILLSLNLFLKLSNLLLNRLIVFF